MSVVPFYTRCLLRCLVCFSLITTLAVQAEPLEQSLQKALENSKTLQIADEKIFLSQLAVKDAQSQFLPKISLRSNFQAPIKGQSHPVVESLEHQEDTLSLSGRISLLGTEALAVKKARLALEKALLERKVTEQSLVYDTANVYINTLIAQQVQALRKKSQRLFANYLTIAQKRFEIGNYTALEVAQAKQKHLQAMTQVSEAQSTLDAQQVLFRMAIGEEAKDLSLPTITITLSPLPPEKILESFSITNAQIRTTKLSIAMSEIDKDLAKKNFGPSLDFHVSFSLGLYRKPPQNKTSQQNPSRYSGAIGFQLDIPLFSGGENLRSTQRAQSQYQSLTLNLRISQDKLEYDLVNALNHVKIAQTKKESALLAIKIANDILIMTKAQQQSGQKTFLETLEAEVKMIEAEINKLRTEQDFHLSLLTLWKLKGTLTLRALLETLKTNKVLF